MKLSHAVRAAALGAVFVCAQGMAFDAAAQTRPLGSIEERRSQGIHPDRDDDVPAAPPPRASRKTPTAKPPAKAEQRPLRAEPPPERNADAAVAHCHGLRRDLEAVVRLEHRGGDVKLMESLRVKRQSIYQQQLKGGCI